MLHAISSKWTRVNEITNNFPWRIFLTDYWKKSENISGWVQTQFSLPDLAISNGPSPTPWSSSPSLFGRVQTQCTFVSVLFDSSPQRIVSWDFYERTTFYLTLVQGGFFSCFICVKIDRVHRVAWRLITIQQGGSKQNKGRSTGANCLFS